MSTIHSGFIAKILSDQLPSQLLCSHYIFLAGLLQQIRVGKMRHLQPAAPHLPLTPAARLVI